MPDLKAGTVKGFVYEYKAGTHYESVKRFLFQCNMAVTYIRYNKTVDYSIYLLRISL